MSDKIIYLNDRRPEPIINDGGKARIQARREALGLREPWRMNWAEPFHEDMVMLRPDPELPCDCEPVG